MSIKNILVTGGAGFIGSFIVDLLIKKGYEVTILDNLDNQVHQGKKPKYLNKQARFIEGDVTNVKDLEKALKNIQAVYHEASVVGVGQSMYAIDYYIYNNSLGTARLLDFIANNPKKHKVERLILASSMSAYGEGLYYCKKDGQIRGSLRDNQQMKKKDWELRCPKCQRELVPIPIPETEKLACTSIYAVSKQSQEDMFMLFGKAYKIPTTAFRYFNVYGPRQSLSNPYTGVAAIFLSRLKNDRQPIVYEDGNQSRDFISVYDIAEANVMALKNKNSFDQVFNLGTQNPLSINEVGLTISKVLGKHISPNINQQYRPGDVRHCFADITKAKKLLNWSNKISFEEGMKDLIEWSRTQTAKDDFEQASDELKAKGLVRK